MTEEFEIDDDLHPIDGVLPHCPDCRCLASHRDAFCYQCGACVHHVPEDCDDWGNVLSERGEFCPPVPSDGTEQTR